MDQNKRALTEYTSFDDKTKRMRTCDQNEMNVTRLEDLPNEIFYEIFDYFNGLDMLDAFSYLNLRFQSLIFQSLLPIKIIRSTSFYKEPHYRKFIRENRHRIISCHLYGPPHYLSIFWSLQRTDTPFQITNTSLQIIDASCQNFESLILNQVSHDTVMRLIPILMNLPRFFSLKIRLMRTDVDLYEIHKRIFQLPVLKHYSLSASLSSPARIIADNHDICSSMERLVLDSECTDNQLLKFLSFTPRLTHLNCKAEYLTFSMKKLPTIPCNLKHVSMKDSWMDFDNLELVIKSWYSKVEVLRIETKSKASYLDAARWQRLISKYMPYLRVFDLQYIENYSDTIIHEPHNFNLNEFLSPFWIQRGWSLEVKSTVHNSLIAEISVAVQPLKKQWYELQDDINLNRIVPFAHLHVAMLGFQLMAYCPCEQRYIPSSISTNQFTSLCIELDKFSVYLLTHFICMLPNLNSLTILSNVPEQKKILSMQETEMFNYAASNNKITKVNLEQMTELDQIHLLIDLCAQMSELQVRCRSTSDCQWLIRYISSKKNQKLIPNLRLLSLWISNADNHLMNALKKIIDTENLMQNYTIKRICDRIFIRWNESF